MVRKNESVNIGYCQGVVIGGIYSPTPSVAIVSVRVKSERRNPVTKRFDMQGFKLVALGEMAEQVKRACKDGDRVTVSYYLKERVQISKRTGIGSFVNEMIIKDVYIRSEDERGRAGIVNTGFLQGRFIGVVKAPNAEGIYNLSVLYNSDLKYGPQHFNFVIYGALGEKIMTAYEKRQYVSIQYKVERIKHFRDDGKTDYFTNYVVEKIS